MAHAETFEKFFRAADTDGDERISGQEAVAFLSGSGLPQVTLAKVWQYADHRQAGFLLKPDFINALKLITVAQTGRELTPDIVRAALTGPAAGQIPPPKISNLAPSGPSQREKAQAPPASGHGTQSIQPKQATGDAYVARTPQVNQPAAYQPPGSFPQYGHQAAPPQVPGWGTSSMQAPLQTAPAPVQPLVQQAPRNVQSQGSARVTSQGSPSGSFQGHPSASTSTPISPGPTGFGSGSFQPTSVEAVRVVPPAADPFSAFQVPTSSAPAAQTPIPAPAPAMQVSGGSSSGLRPPITPETLGGFPNNASSVMNASAPVQRIQKPQPAGIKAALEEDLFGGLGFTAGAAPPPSTFTPGPPSATAIPQGQLPRMPTPQLGSQDRQGQQPQFAAPAQQGASPGAVVWPRMTVADAQRYTQLFASVDTDRDGKLTGAQARDVLMGLRLPRGVLKQVWDLSDQDNDGMLSLREFCTAFYLIDRFREGRPLPASLPAGIHFDEPAADPRTQIAAQRMAQAQMALAQNAAGMNVPTWRLDPGMLSSSSSAPIPSRADPAGQTSLGQMPVSAKDASDVVTGPPVYRSKVPPLEAHKLNQLSKEESANLAKKHKEAEDAGKKVWETESEILDSKQKIDFYRTKMQEIIMFKTRCDNQLNEISERSSADKREAEELAKKYDDKYKQTAGVNARLAQEEAALSDLQEKKAELMRAVVRLEQGGDPNGRLQERTDKLASDLEELRKIVNRRAKQLGLKVRPILGSSELPFGWQSGLQENAVEWDDEWDEFDDHGFSTVQDIGEGGGPALKLDPNDPFPPSSKLPLPLMADEADGTSKPEELIDSPTGPVSSPSGETDFKDSVKDKLEHDEDAVKEAGDGFGQDPDSPHPFGGFRVTSAEEESGPVKGGDAKTFDRYADVAESREFEHESLNGRPAYSDSTSVYEGPESSANNTYGDVPMPWASYQRNDEEVNSRVRSSWGIQSSTAASTEVSHDFGHSTAAHFDGTSEDFTSKGANGGGTIVKSDDENEAPKEHEEEVDDDPFASLGSFKNKTGAFGSLAFPTVNKSVSSAGEKTSDDKFGDDRSVGSSAQWSAFD